MAKKCLMEIATQVKMIFSTETRTTGQKDRQKVANHYTDPKKRFFEDLKDIRKYM